MGSLLPSLGGNPRVCQGERLKGCWGVVDTLFFLSCATIYQVLETGVVGRNFAHEICIQFATMAEAQQQSEDQGLGPDPIVREPSRDEASETEEKGEAAFEVFHKVLMLDLFFYPALYLS